METIQDFYDFLDQEVDWLYDLTDAGNRYEAGRKLMDEVYMALRRHPEWNILYSRYHAHIFSGETWGTDKLPKPERPQ
jgi:hypothetical protein